MSESRTSTNGNFNQSPPDAYDELLRRESTPPNPNEIISTSFLTPDSHEWSRLVESGVDEGIVGGGKVTRQALLDAGFVFTNHLGQGEKPLLSDIIMNGRGEEIDLSMRSFLTSEELGIVLESQGGRRTDDEDVRRKMLDFLANAERAESNRRERLVKIVRDAITLIQEDDKELFAEYWRDNFMNETTKYLSGLVLSELVAGIPLVKVGSIPIEIFGTRRSALAGAPSPFLDAGYHFDVNQDVTLFPHDTTRTRRLNSVVVHLLSRGLSESGGSRNGSHDQTYINRDEFLALYEDVRHPDAPFDHSDVKLVLVRILHRANPDSEHLKRLLKSL